MSTKLQIAFALLIFFTSLNAQTTYYVNNVAGSDSNPGTSPTAPKRTIQAAILAASSDDNVSVASTSQVYSDTVMISGKTLTFTSTNGRPQVRFLRVDLATHRLTFTGGFVLDTLDLISGQVYGSDSLTISDGGKIIRRSPDATVEQPLRYAGQVDIEYTGTSTIQQGNETPTIATNALRNLTLNFQTSSASLRLTRDVRCGGTLYFVNGLLVTDTNTVELTQGTSILSQGFDRRGVAGSNISHVVGNVRKQVQATRNEFPVGSIAYFRPVAITFNADPSARITVGYHDERPVGIAGLPIANGVSAGVDIVRYPPFFWTITSNVSLGAVRFQLDLLATGFTAYDDIRDVRIIRRTSLARDSNNEWVRQEGEYSPDPVGLPVVRCLNTTGGIERGGTLFTYGLRGPYVYHPFAVPTLTDSNPTYRRSLIHPAIVDGNIGPLFFSVAVDDSTIATASISNDTLIVTKRATGSTTLRLRAIDGYDGSSIILTATINVVTSIRSEFEKFPEHFLLQQNYPNPFNPLTIIEFGLPQEEFARLTIYDLLGNEIETLVNERLNPGSYRVRWNAANHAAGVYFYRLQAGQYTETRKLVILK